MTESTSSSSNADGDALAGVRGQFAPDVVGADERLRGRAVDQHREADRARASEIFEGIDGGGDGPSGVEDVVDEDDDPPVHRSARDTGPADGERRPGAEIVAVHRDVEFAGGHLRAVLGLGDDRGQPRQGTPRVGMPNRSSPSVPWFRSRISCAIRDNARVMSSPDQMTRA